VPPQAVDAGGELGAMSASPSGRPISRSKRSISRMMATATTGRKSGGRPPSFNPSGYESAT
jgi:hypothetical protein